MLWSLFVEPNLPTIPAHDIEISAVFIVPQAEMVSKNVFSSLNCLLHNNHPVGHQMFLLTRLKITEIAHSLIIVFDYEKNETSFCLDESVQPPFGRTVLKLSMHPFFLFVGKDFSPSFLLLKLYIIPK